MHMRFKLVNPFHDYLIEFSILCIPWHDNLSSVVTYKARKTQQKFGFASFWLLSSSGKIKKTLNTIFLILFSSSVLHCHKWKRYMNAILITFLCTTGSFFVDLNDSQKNGLIQFKALDKNVSYLLHYAKRLKHWNWKLFWTGLSGTIN